MKYKQPILVLLVIVIAILTLRFLNDGTIDNYTLHSTDGCCHINVKVKRTTAPNLLYIITYTDNTTGTEHVQHETHEADAEWMINTFQDHCMDTH